MTTDTTPTLRTTVRLMLKPERATHYAVPESFEFDCLLGGSHVRVRATLRDANLHLDCGVVRTLEPVQGPALSPSEWKTACSLAEEMLSDVSDMMLVGGRWKSTLAPHGHDRNIWLSVKAQVLQHLAAGASTEAEAALSAWVATYLELLCRRQDARANDEWLEQSEEAQREAAFELLEQRLHGH